MARILEAIVYLDEPKVRALQRTFSKIVSEPTPNLTTEDLAAIEHLVMRFLQDMEEVEDVVTF